MIVTPSLDHRSLNQPTLSVWRRFALKRDAIMVNIKRKGFLLAQSQANLFTGSHPTPHSPFKHKGIYSFAVHSKYLVHNRTKGTSSSLMQTGYFYSVHKSITNTVGWPSHNSAKSHHIYYSHIVSTHTLTGSYL